jgi:predicted RNA binding protein YcfA (HicA-like mRNA interferase family)
MSRKDKLIARLKTRPKDFTFDELKTLLELCGYVMSNLGKTSGSRVRFKKRKKALVLHKPHPQKELMHYQVKEVINQLTKEGII